MQKIIDKLLKKYPFAKITAYESKYKIEIMQIEIPAKYQNQGIGTDIINTIKEYANKIKKPIVLTPESEQGRKKDLDRFYKNLGFVHNKGRNIDYSLSSPLSKTMYWNTFKEWINQKKEKQAIRYVHKNGKGLMNNSSLNYDKLNDDEYSDIEEEYLKLQQPPTNIHNQNVLFVFNEKGQKQHKKLIELLTKASKTGVKKQLIPLDSYKIVWESDDGQLGLIPK